VGGRRCGVGDGGRGLVLMRSMDFGFSCRFKQSAAILNILKGNLPLFVERQCSGYRPK